MASVSKERDVLVLKGLHDEVGDDSAVVGVRLHDVAFELAKEAASRVQTNSISDMPDTTELYLRSVESGLGMLGQPNARPVLERAREIVSQLRGRQATVAPDADKAHCGVVIECFGNYLDKMALRLLPSGEAV